MKIAIIGAGNMGASVARGLAKGSLVPACQITVSNPSMGKLEALRDEFPEMNVTPDNRQAVVGADVVILAVKPWKIKEVIDEIKGGLDYQRQVVASMAGGMGTDTLSEFLKRGDEALPAVYYLIPNTAISVRKGITFMTSVRAPEGLDAQLLAVFRELGEAMWIEERLMGAATALASCGIAYAMRYIRAATEGGVELGFYAQDAQHIVMQTMAGAVALLEETRRHPEQEIDRVTTPGGITIKGLNAMEEAGFTTSVIKGLKASVK